MTEQQPHTHHDHSHSHGASCACGHDHAHHAPLKRPVAPSLLSLGVGPKLALASVALAVVWATTFWAMQN